MTADDFRQLALSLPETTEREHMNHPDFRVRGKIFATMGYPGAEWAMVKLPPEQQANFVQAEPRAFVPVKGGWGLKGCTSVVLAAARKPMVRKALAEAWNAAVVVKPKPSRKVKPG